MRMMHKRFWTSLAGAVIIAAVPQHAASVWSCTYRMEPESPPFTVKVVIDEGAKSVNAFVSDYVNKPTEYHIVEDASFGLIAVLHHSDSVVRDRPQNAVLGIFFLDKETGASKRIDIYVRGSYENRSKGICKRQVETK